MKTRLLFYCATLITLCSCNAIYVEKPVPQSGSEVKTIPNFLSGLYQLTEPGKEQEPTLFKSCLYFDRISDSQLLISSETTLDKKDIPALETLYQQEQKAGHIQDYQITGQYIFCTFNVPQSDHSIKQESRMTQLVDQGGHYLLPSTVEPLLWLDLQSQTTKRYDVKKFHAPTDDQLLPMPDSIASNSFPIVFRTLNKTFYLNIREKEQPLWSFFTVTPTGKDELDIKLCYVDDKSHFEAKLDYYNRITPFKNTDGTYSINPNDQALERLLAEPDLFETWHLKRYAKQ